MARGLQATASAGRVIISTRRPKSPPGSCRHPRWEDRLHAYVEKAFHKPHVYGRHDCLLFAAEWVRAVTGHDFGRGHRGKYKSPASASVYLRGLGFSDPEAMLDALFEQKPTAFAQRGDLVLIPSVLVPGLPEGWPVPAGVFGDYALTVGIGPDTLTNQGQRDGLHKIPRAMWLKAYAIGEHHSGKLKVRKKRVTKPPKPAGKS